MPQESLEIIKKACEITGETLSEFLRQSAYRRLEELSIITTLTKQKFAKNEGEKEAEPATAGGDQP